MLSNEQLAYAILASLNIAILRRVAPKCYEMLGETPLFYESFFPSTEKGPCLCPWEHSSMLEIFFDDVELFFINQEQGLYSSGIWQEESKTGEESALIAIAQVFNMDEVVIIRLLQDDFNERVGILRKARTQLLENRALSKDLEEFKKKAALDGLTKVFNRATFMEFLPQEIIRAEDDGHSLSALMMDIDDFKVINDTYGHIAGDRVLRDIGAILQSGVRRGDIVARYGGEEFVLLLPSCEIQQALAIGEKLRKTIENHEITDLPRVTMSIGCTDYRKGEAPDSFVQRMDMAMYEAKRNGKNRICMR